MTPEAIDALLAAFRRWLEETATVPGNGMAPTLPAVPPTEPIDLSTLLGQFIAVRHEVNLQTRATRAQQEQNAETLRLLSEAVQRLEWAEENSAQSQQQAIDEQVRPLLKTLIDLRDALALAEREARRVQEALLPALEELGIEPEPLSLSLDGVEVPGLEPGSRPLLARLLGVQGVAPRALDDWRQQARTALEKAAQERLEGSRVTQQQRHEQARQGTDRVRQVLTSLLAGYGMGLQRVDRALEQHGLERIPAVGEPFDPELMEVLEAADNTGRPPGEVLAEVRRGYLWRGRVFRFAQVRVARS
jgi:molecular chaperone GrpE